MSSLSKRILNALTGAFLGALGIFSATYLLTDVNLIFIGIVACICGVLSYIWGEPFLQWLKDLWWRI